MESQNFSIFKPPLAKSWLRPCIRAAWGHIKVGRLEFDFLAESEQKILTVGIYNFSAWRSAFKRVSVDVV